jgi:hypothetical protein
MRAISAIAKSHHVVKMIYCSTEAEIANEVCHTATRIKQPSTIAIPTGNVAGKAIARIPQTKIRMPQIINHVDVFLFMAGLIDSIFIPSFFMFMLRC